MRVSISGWQQEQFYVVAFACCLLSEGCTHGRPGRSLYLPGFISLLKSGRDEWQLKVTSENPSVTQRCCGV